MAAIKSALKCWRDFNLPEHQKILDLEAIDVGNRQDTADKSRKKLIELTRDFKKNTEDDIRKKVSPLIKALQSEVDQLSKRSKASENSFLSLYKKLLEVPDPVPALEQAQNAHQQMSKIKDLELENQKLRETLDEYHVEFAEVKNQEVTIKDLKEKVKEFEEKTDEKIQVKLKEREAALQRDFTTKEKQLQEVQLNLASQLGEAEGKIKSLQIDLEEVNAELFDVKSKAEEESAARASEVEMIGVDLERANQRCLSAEKYAESLKEQLTHALEARKVDKTDQERLDQSLNSITTASLEVQIASKDREIAQLVDEVHHLQSVASKLRESSKREIAILEEQLTEKNSLIDSFKAKLEAQEDYDEVKRELNILKIIEFGEKVEGSSKGSSPKSLEKLLLEKNRGLQSENANLKVTKNELNDKCENLQRHNSEAVRTIKEQQDLIKQLENDLLNLNSLPSTFRGQGEGEATPAAPDAELVEKAVQGALQEAEQDLEKSESGSLLSIVSSQRERFRTRNLELEAQTRHQQQQITGLQNEVDSIRSDNIKLFEKIKFLQSYPTQTSNVNVNDDSVSRYSSHYEERIDPFTAFSRKEKQRKYTNLSAPEKVTLSLGRFILSNKIARTIVFFYTILLHLLVFLVLYKMAYTESCKRDFASDCAKRFAEHMHSFHEKGR